MKFKHLYTLLTLLLALYFVPAAAQTKKKAKHIVTKATKKKPAKQATAAQKTNAQNLGEAASKVKVDTTKKLKPQGGSLSEEIVVTTAYKPVLADAVKIRINPDLSDQSPFKAPLLYTPVDKRLELNTDIKPLSAMKRPAERDSDLTNNYIKVGLGNLKTTYGEAYFANGRDQALQVGGFIKHLMQQGSIFDQKSMNDQAEIFGKTIGAETSLSGHIDYNYSSNYFYGYNPFSPPPTLMTDKQHFNTISAEGELAKNYKDVEKDFTYALKLKGYLFNDAYQAKEGTVVLSGFLNETIKNLYVGLAGSLDLSTQQDSSYNLNNSLVRANPYIKFQSETYKIDAGINIVDQFGYASHFYLFPAARVEFEVVPKYVRLFAEATGDVNKSSLLDFYTINPFLGQNLTIKNSVDQLDLAAGFKGTITSGLGFKVTVFHNNVKDMPLFVSDFDFTKGYNRFKIIYDNGVAHVTGITGELDYKASEDVDIFGRVEYKNYEMASEPQAWNMPKFKLTGGMLLHVSSKVDLKASLYIRGIAYDPNPVKSGNTTITSTINGSVDLSGGFEYHATKRLSVFVNANNLLNGLNETWLYYPAYGFNIFGGVGYAF